ncbi:TolB family protein [Emticicia sp. SJ17W-69]|uniref:TolB family protein n=1 Tax=Emticicia sp. SJ17W-69 TaxID=3421657 RepID=UPI003EBA876D
MKKLSFLLLITTSLYAQNGTEIYLMDLSKEGGYFILTNPKNITKRIGYDNQPFFHPTQPLIYYTAMKDGQTDIWSYNYKTNIYEQITNTIDSEYSPNVTPDLKYLSCIVQRKSNGDQDLVKYKIDNPRNTQIIFESQKTGKIGYQAWLNSNELITFVLGTPQTLHYQNIITKKDTIIAPNIGRSLHLMPNQKTFSFVQQIGEKWFIRSFNPAKNTIKDLAESSPESEHYNAWTTDGIILESRNAEIYWYDSIIKNWEYVILPENLPKKKISRMAVKGNKIAVVIDE